MKSKLEKKLFKPSTCITLPDDYMERVFLFESKCLRMPTIEIINSLFNLYTLGIEYYTNISNMTIATIYQRKLVFVSSLIDNTKTKETVAIEISKPIVNEIEIKKTINETSQELMNTFHDSLDAFTELVNNSLTEQQESIINHKCIMKRARNRKVSIYRKKEITKAPLLKTINQSLFKIPETNMPQSTKNNRRYSVAQNVIAKKATFKKEKPINLFELDNKFNKITLFCNQTYLHKIKNFIEECNIILKDKMIKYENYYKSYKLFEIVLHDDKFPDKQSIQTTIDNLAAQYNEENNKDDETNKERLVDYYEIEPDSHWDTKEINDINRRIFKDITNIILIN